MKQKPVPTQVIDSLYTRALEDTLIIFEQLKPAYRSLQKAHEYQSKENEALRGQNRTLQGLSQMQNSECQREIKAAKKAGNGKFWKGLGAGALTAFLIKLLL